VPQSGMLTISNAPQYFDRHTTAHLLWTVVACLVPAALWGIYAFGPSALFVLVSSVASAFCADWFMAARRGESIPKDGHAILTGLLIGMTMPPAIPVWIPVLAALFAIFVVKWPLGGAGSAWIHPAAAAWLFAFLCWPQLMSTYSLPVFGSFSSGAPSFDAFGAVNAWFTGNQASGFGPADILSSQGYFRSSYDVAGTDFLNRFLMGHLGASLPGTYIDALLGTGPGAIGEVSSDLLMLGSVVLMARGIVKWHIPFALFGSFAVLTYIFGGLPFGGGFFSGDILFNSLHGSFLLVLFFVSTDISTGPLSYRGRVFTGVAIGVLTFAIEFFGRSVDASLLAVLVSNMLTGPIDRWCRFRRVKGTVVV